MENRIAKFCNIIALLFTLNSFAENNTNSTAKEVVLYPQGAQVTRMAKVELKKGKNEIVIANLSPFMNTSSIQVNGNGNFTIASVAHKYNFLEEEQKKNQLTNLKARVDSLENEINIQNAYLTVAIEQENMLIKNQSIGGANVGVKTMDLKEAVEYQKQKMTELELEQVKLNSKITSLTLLKDKFEKQATATKSLSTKTTSDIVITINSNESINTELKISYFVSEAKWLPYYDVKVKNINSPIDFSYKAKISQSTGEEWKDVMLTLSTSEPKLTAQKPYLQKWNLRLNDYSNNNYYTSNLDVSGLPQYNFVQGKVNDASTGEALIGVNVTLKGTTIGTVTDIDGNYALEIPNGAKILVFSYVGYSNIEKPIASSIVNTVLAEDGMRLEEVVITSSKRKKRFATSSYNNEYEKDGTNAVETEETYTPIDVNFNIKTPYTIISDGKINSVDINSYDVPATYKYYAIPKLDKSAFLTAFLSNWTDLNLLPGEANLYFENTYVGKSVINPDITEDTLEISLGRDKNVIVKRELVKDFSKKQLIGSNKIVNKSWEISIKNNKKQPIEIIVQDQFPISTQKEISVEQVEKSNAELDEETGILKWKLFIESTIEKKVQLKYAVKYPKGDYLKLE
ncbi:MAG TPA: DUF4139 domain-containing protein [Chitinophagales bacterium]|nr:DUF4139 domain-containing protein [Chitinophagales bacterium]